MPSGLTALQNEPLRKRVLDALRDAILSGELKPGQALVETELAADLGVSRAPLREALQQLAAEGLVEVVPYRGAAVRMLHRKDIEELYSLRIALETFAARRIIEANLPEASRRLHAIFDDMLAAADAGDISRVSQIDRQFHDALIELSDHSLLQSMWNAVNLRVRQVMALRNRRNSDIRQIAFNHLPIIEAIDKRDLPEATRLLETHIASAGDLIAEGWDTVINGAVEDGGKS
ncbi:GntR family transcriptional regulator [Anaerolineae bacterium CFX9]|jgi:DNA-binding GntR family transcriptional regulator|nr:GntR family transcriptional regulator [Anaerolineae bacterium CFX9]